MEDLTSGPLGSSLASAVTLQRRALSRRRIWVDGNERAAPTHPWNGSQAMRATDDDAASRVSVTLL